MVTDTTNQPARAAVILPAIRRAMQLASAAVMQAQLVSIAKSGLDHDATLAAYRALPLSYGFVGVQSNPACTWVSVGLGRISYRIYVSASDSMRVVWRLDGRAELTRVAVGGERGAA